MRDLIVTKFNTTSIPLKIFIYGITGRMGQEISALIDIMPEYESVGGTSRSAQNALMACDVALDFSHPASLKTNLDEVITARTPILIGTTGLDEAQSKLCEAASNEIPLLYAPNTSLGIAVLKNLVTTAASQLDQNYDIEIFETHHRHKIDAPSGTALSLGESAKKGRTHSIGSIENLPVERQGQRPVGDIGYAVHRGGGVTGDHAVRFIGDEEIIELSHRSLSRRLLARGALTAAKWLAGHAKEPGFYRMDDVVRR